MAVTVNVERKGVEVNWDSQSSDEKVQVFGKGADGKWHNTPEMPNDGHAFLAYPADFVGESEIEVRTLSGEVLDAGMIEIG